MFAQPFPESGRILVTLLAWEFFPLLGGKSAGRAVTELARWRSWQPVSSPWTVRGAVQFGATGRGHAGASRSAPSSAQALCSPSPSLPRGASSPCVVGGMGRSGARCTCLCATEARPRGRASCHGLCRRTGVLFMRFLPPYIVISYGMFPSNKITFDSNLILLSCAWRVLVPRWAGLATNLASMASLGL